eukprot:TRINITY_DN4428_c0_g1_i1.p1 TRINITY_DN4428_c0_g1~~TRINITY_DN4428_c0_g1_i1.p1  ORF type:complete len:921 (+),score=55.63 TRINITY_DN4428_c0_g1_i1:22-2763(+)
MILLLAFLRCVSAYMQLYSSAACMGPYAQIVPYAINCTALTVNTSAYGTCFPSGWKRFTYSASRCPSAKWDGGLLSCPADGLCHDFAQGSYASCLGLATSTCRSPANDATCAAEGTTYVTALPATLSVRSDIYPVSCSWQISATAGMTLEVATSSSFGLTVGAALLISPSQLLFCNLVASNNFLITANIPISTNIPTSGLALGTVAPLGLQSGPTVISSTLVSVTVAVTTSRTTTVTCIATDSIPTTAANIRATTPQSSATCTQGSKCSLTVPTNGCTSCTVFCVLAGSDCAWQTLTPVSPGVFDCATAIQPLALPVQLTAIPGACNIYFSSWAGIFASAEPSDFNGAVGFYSKSGSLLRGPFTSLPECVGFLGPFWLNVSTTINSPAPVVLRLYLPSYPAFLDGPRVSYTTGSSIRVIVVMSADSDVMCVATETGTPAEYFNSSARIAVASGVSQRLCTPGNQCGLSVTASCSKCDIYCVVDDDPANCVKSIIGVENIDPDAVMCNGVKCTATKTGQCVAGPACVNSQCITQFKPAGTVCDDYDDDTVNDTCAQGTCSGVVPNCSLSDFLDCYSRNGLDLFNFDTETGGPIFANAQEACGWWTTLMSCVLSSYCSNHVLFGQPLVAGCLDIKETWGCTGLTCQRPKRSAASTCFVGAIDSYVALSANCTIVYNNCVLRNGGKMAALCSCFDQLMQCFYAGFQCWDSGIQAVCNDIVASYHSSCSPLACDAQTIKDTYDESQRVRDVANPVAPNPPTVPTASASASHTYTLTATQSPTPLELSSAVEVLADASFAATKFTVAVAAELAIQPEQVLVTPAQSLGRRLWRWLTQSALKVSVQFVASSRVEAESLAQKFVVTTVAGKYESVGVPANQPSLGVTTVQPAAVPVASAAFHATPKIFSSLLLLCCLVLL